MDPSTAIGLASAIVQFIDFSAKVISRLEDFNSARDRAPKAFRELKVELPLLVVTLQRTKDQINGDRISKQDQEALLPVVNSCLEQIQKLDKVLVDVLPVAADSTWTRSRKAVRSIRKESSVEQIRAALKSHVLELTHFQATGHTDKLNLVIREGCQQTTVSKPKGHFLIPTLAVAGYIERPELEEMVEDCFIPKPGSSTQVAVLIGMGGQGKSQLTLKICRSGKESGKFDSVLWIDATSDSSIEASITQIAARFGDTAGLETFAEKLAFFKDEVESWTSPWLLVFDNYDRPDLTMNISTCFSQSHRGCVLVTSRHASSKRLGSPVYVGGMSEEQALALLLARCEIRPEVSSIKEGKAIVEQLGYHPLAVDQAGSFISSKKLPMSLFMKQYTEKKARVLQYTPALSEYRKKLDTSDAETALSVFTTLELSLKAIPGDAANQVAVEDFLTLASFFNIASIGEDLFRSLVPEKSIWPWLFKSECGEIVGDAEKSQIWDHDKFEDTIEMLGNLSLIQNVHSGELTYFSLHPLVKDWLQLRQDDSQCGSYTSQVGDLLVYHTARTDMIMLTLEARQHLLAHVDACLTNQAVYFSKPGDGGLTIMKQMWSLAVFVQTVGRLDQALSLLERILEGCEHLLGEDDPRTLSAVQDLAVLHLNQGRLGLAELCSRRAVQGMEQELGPEHLETLEALKTLGGIFTQQGHFDLAEQTLSRALAGSQKAVGTDQQLTLSIFNNLGILYSKQSRLDLAKKMYTQALQGTEKVRGEDHIFTLDIVVNLACLNMRLNEFDLAEEMCKRALAGYDRTIGRDDLSACSTLLTYGQLLQRKGDYIGAEEMVEAALRGYVKAVGPSFKWARLAKETLMDIQEELKRGSGQNQAQEGLEQSPEGVPASLGH